MLFRFLNDPGPCIICGAPHTSCTAPQPTPPQGEQQAAQTAATAPAAVPTTLGARPAPGETFSTSTYRRRR